MVNDSFCVLYFSINDLQWMFVEYWNRQLSCFFSGRVHLC
jgi:hypothetical protein